jgi:hypothetical protein
MVRKYIFILLFLYPYLLFAQDNNYLSLLIELDDYIENNFVSPFYTKNVKFLNDNLYGFGFKKNPFTNDIFFSNSGIISCDSDENIYSMDDGIIMEIGYNGSNIFILVKYNEIEIYYHCVSPININEGDKIEKRQLIGRISSPYYSYGPALIVKIKYKNQYFDPYFLLYNIIIYGD